MAGVFRYREKRGRFEIFSSDTLGNNKTTHSGSHASFAYNLSSVVCNATPEQTPCTLCRGLGRYSRAPSPTSTARLLNRAKNSHRLVKQVPECHPCPPRHSYVCRPRRLVKPYFSLVNSVRLLAIRVSRYDFTIIRNQLCLFTRVAGCPALTIHRIRSCFVVKANIPNTNVSTRIKQSISHSTDTYLT